MLSKKQQEIARAIDKARRTGWNPDYQLGIQYAAHSIADDLCNATERFHFLLMCGVDFHK